MSREDGRAPPAARRRSPGWASFEPRPSAARTPGSSRVSRCPGVRRCVVGSGRPLGLLPPLPDGAADAAWSEQLRGCSAKQTGAGPCGELMWLSQRGFGSGGLSSRPFLPPFASWVQNRGICLVSFNKGKAGIVKAAVACCLRWCYVSEHKKGSKKFVLIEAYA